MPATTVEELKQFDTATGKADSTEYTRGFLVVGESLSAYDAATAVGIPTGGTAHPSHAAAYVEQISVRPHEGGAGANDMTAYVVTCNYSTFAIDSPENRPDEYSWNSETQTVEYFYDKDDSPVVSSNGEPFEAQPAKLTSMPTCTVVKYVTTATIARELYVGYVNSDTVTLDGQSFTARKILFAGLSISPEKTEHDTTYRTETYTFKINPEEWTDKVYAVGYQELVADGGNDVRVPITDPKTGQPIQRPWPLNANGTAKDNADDDPAELTFKPYEEVAMSGWGFV